MHFLSEFRCVLVDPEKRQIIIGRIDADDPIAIKRLLRADFITWHRGSIGAIQFVVYCDDFGRGVDGSKPRPISIHQTVHSAYPSIYGPALIFVVEGTRIRDITDQELKALNLSSSPGSLNAVIWS